MRSLATAFTSGPRLSSFSIWGMSHQGTARLLPSRNTRRSRILPRGSEGASPSHGLPIWEKPFALTSGVIALALVLAGCTGQTTTNGPETSESVDTHDGHDHGHAHPSKGPHDGELIELGNEEYHAELLHDEETGAVTIYILDGAASKQVPIDATEIIINAQHDGRPEQFKLTADPDDNDPDGKSSRFVSIDTELAAHLDEEGAEPRLVLTINGKSYRGQISHDHEHEHNHVHE